MSGLLVRFVLVSGVAALINLGTRVVLSLMVAYPMAIALAFCAGLTSAFVLNRLFVFDRPAIPLREQIFWFIAINVLALAQTMAVSLILEYELLPRLGVTWHSQTIAHAIGIAVPIATSYLGHRRFSFRSGDRP